MAMLSDGRQATKTGNGKELVLVRVVKNSISVYFIVALLEIVNLGIYSGAFIMMKGNRPLLITIHCASHRLGLALKDAVKKISKFAEYGNFYTNMFYLFKNFTKLKRETKNTAAALNISYYTYIHKVHGTRFLNYRCRCFKHLLHNWPALITVMEMSWPTIVDHPGTQGQE